MVKCSECKWRSYIACDLKINNAVTNATMTASDIVMKDLMKKHHPLKVGRTCGVAPEDILRLHAMTAAFNPQAVLNPDGQCLYYEKKTFWNKFFKW